MVFWLIINSDILKDLQGHETVILFVDRDKKIFLLFL